MDAATTIAPRTAAELADVVPAVFRDDATLAMLATPEATACFEAIWRGERAGFSEDKTRENLARYLDLQADLEAGLIRPERVIGRGVRKPKTTARAWIRQRIQDCQNDLATAGRSNAVNCSNVGYHLRTRTAG